MASSIGVAMSLIANKRELMVIMQRLIPVMDETEIQALAITTNSIIEHMIKRGVPVTDDGEEVEE